MERLRAQIMYAPGKAQTVNMKNVIGPFVMHHRKICKLNEEGDGAIDERVPPPQDLCEASEWRSEIKHFALFNRIVECISRLADPNQQIVGIVLKPVCHSTASEMECMRAPRRRPASMQIAKAGEL